MPPLHFLEKMTIILNSQLRLTPHDPDHVTKLFFIPVPPLITIQCQTEGT